VAHHLAANFRNQGKRKVFCIAQRPDNVLFRLVTVRMVTKSSYGDLVYRFDMRLCLAANGYL
jgi:hypothetical protein